VRSRSYKGWMRRSALLAAGLVLALPAAAAAPAQDVTISMRQYRSPTSGGFTL
jgi:hypothetical protein